MTSQMCPLNTCCATHITCMTHCINDSTSLIIIQNYFFALFYSVILVVLWLGGFGLEMRYCNDKWCLLGFSLFVLV
uniref:Uncharacterized protein n=1 Tax=Anguilla anguilla TaxID=7936 RepID=A0A0E9R802_ANGAN